MRRWEVPVTPETARLARRMLWLVIFAPMAIFVVVGLVAALAGALPGRAGGSFLTVVVVIGLVQLIIVALGRGHHLWGVRLSAQTEPPPAHNEPGIFRHGPK